MASTQRHSSQDQLADRVPGAAERGVRGGKADADADAAVGGDDFEDDVEGREGYGVIAVVVRFGDGDEEYGERHPPDVVA